MREQWLVGQAERIHRAVEGVEVVGGGERARCHRRCAEAQQVGHDDGGVPAERVEAGTEAVTRGGHTV